MDKNIGAACEALLFAAGGAVEFKDLQEALQISEEELEMMKQAAGEAGVIHETD